MNKNVYTKLKKLKPALEEEYGLSRLRMFGSQAREDYDEDSDVDLIVEFHTLKHMTYFKLANMKHRVEDTLNKDVDFVFEHKIYPQLRESILEDAVDV